MEMGEERRAFMKKGIGIFLCLTMLLTVLGPMGAGVTVAKAAEGDLPESYYVQPPVGECSSCGAPLFEREGDWAEDSRCYACWAEKYFWLRPATNLPARSITGIMASVITVSHTFV